MEQHPFSYVKICKLCKRAIKVRLLCNRRATYYNFSPTLINDPTRKDRPFNYLMINTIWSENNLLLRFQNS